MSLDLHDYLADQRELRISDKDLDDNQKRRLRVRKTYLDAEKRKAGSLSKDIPILIKEQPGHFTPTSPELSTSDTTPNSQPGLESAETTFHPFSRLPNELQLMVLEAATQPRIATITYDTSNSALSSDTRMHYTGLMGACPLTKNYVQNETGIEHIFCRLMTNHIPISIDVKTDILFFLNSQALGKFFTRAGLGARQEVRKPGIKRLAVGYDPEQGLPLVMNGTNTEYLFRVIRGEEYLAHTIKAVNWFGCLDKLFLVENPSPAIKYENLLAARREVRQVCEVVFRKELRKWEAIWRGLEMLNGRVCDKWKMPEVEVVAMADLESRLSN